MAGLAAAGAAMGTAIMPGIGTAVGGLAGALVDTFGGGGGGGGQAAPMPSGPTNAANAVYGNGLDGANWFVNFSGSQTASGTVDKPITATGPTQTAAATGGAVIPQPPAPGGSLGGLGGGEYPTWAVLGLAGLALWKFAG